MADPFIAEVRIFAFDFAPKRWAHCDGQIMSLAQNTALFSLLGTTFGGNGQTTFGLPNLQDRVPMHPSHAYPRGTVMGEESVTLTTSQLPPHAHQVSGLMTDAVATERGPATGAVPGVAAAEVYEPESGPATAHMHWQALGVANGAAEWPHNNLMPYLALNFCIALSGIFPPRS